MSNTFNVVKISLNKKRYLKKWRQGYNLCLCGKKFKNENGYVIYPHELWTPLTVCSTKCADFWVLQHA